MLALLVRRLLQGAVVVWLVVTATFVLLRLAPGDPFSSFAVSEEVPEAVRARLRAAYGLDEPITSQYAHFVGNALKGELGWSVSQQEPVRDALLRALPNTLILMGTAFVLALAGGIALGAWQGWRAETRAARFTDRLTLLLLATPEFVVALLLVMGPALALGLFPVARMRDEFAPGGLAGVVDLVHHLVLPAFALALGLATIVARHQRAAVLQLRDATFVQQARARGVDERRIVLRHVLPQALAPVIAVAGAVLPALVGGSVLIERIFSWPGMGRLLVDGVLARDHHLVVGGVLLTTFAVVFGSILADAVQAWLDPRLRRA